MHKVWMYFLFLALLLLSPGMASVVKIPPAKPKDITYSELECTTEDRTIIGEIIVALAENNKISLLFKQAQIKALGAQINHVHPLRFLGTIFSNAQLKTCMPSVFDDYFKRTGFMDGLGPSLSREFEKGKLIQYLDDFAKDVNLSSDALRPFFQSADWEGLVRFLIQS